MDKSELQEKYVALEKKHKEEISTYKKNEKELKLKLMFLEGIANSTIDGFLVVNPYGQKILQNQRTIDLWKIPKEVVDDPDGMRQVEHVMNMTVNPKQFVAEIEYLKDHPNDKSRDELELKDGTVLDRYSSPVIGPDGENYGRIWTFHDVTERKKSELQLLQLNADKDRFISILAHDLRNPFSNLLGFSELLILNLEKYPLEKIKERLKVIRNVAKKTYALLEDTLLWANLKSKNITFNPSTIDINEIILEVTDILEPVAKMKKINIENKVNKELKVFVDTYMLKAILRNLISNAIKFTNKGGKIEISAEQNQSSTTLKISDNGIGIPQNIVGKLFHISSVQSTEGTAKEMGTGLGLILCKEFVEKHGGKIWVESEVNIGTEVCFTIPVGITTQNQKMSTLLF